MAIEIERKFLVKDTGFLEGLSGTPFKQAYLNSSPERTVRVRVAGNQAFLTIKSKTRGISRQEFEYEIPVNEAEDLLELAETPPLIKHRYFIDDEGATWEVDVFSGINQGLVIAEIELPSEMANFNKPDWLGDEVSEDTRYFNSYLSNHPYTTWSKTV